MTIMKNKFKTSIALVLIASMYGCGGDETQDSNPEPLRSSATFTGLAIDGYLANALVWIDLKKNNSLDGFEPFAYTDNQGYFSYNPITGVDYCTSTNPSQAKFCLKTGAVQDNVVIKISNGIDLSTGELFKGVMSTKVATVDAKNNYQALINLGSRPAVNSESWMTELSNIQTKVSPISSLHHYLPDGVSIVSILLSVGIDIPGSTNDTEVLGADYIDGLATANRLSSSLLKAAVTLQRVVDTYTLHLNKAATSIDLGTNGLPSSAADAVWQALAEGVELRPNINSLTNLERVAQLSTEHFISQLEAAGALLDANVKRRIEEKASDTQLIQHLGFVINNANAHLVGSNKAKLLSATQNLELIVMSVDNVLEGKTSNSSAAALSGFLATPDNSVITALQRRQQQDINGTKGGEIDLSTLSKELTTAINTQQDIEANINSFIASSSLATIENPDSTSFWQGNKLTLSGVQDGNEQGQIIVFFKGDNTDASGELIACIAYNNDEDASDNIIGQRVVGSWSLPDPESPNRISLLAKGFSIQMKVLGETLGQNIPADQQISSIPRDDNTLYGKFRFVLNGDSASWHGDSASVNQRYGLSAFDTTPISDDECQSQLVLF